jgi:flagellar biosynthesis protein FlhA
MGWVARGEVGLALGIIGIIVLLILPVPAFCWTCSWPSR